MRKTIETYIVCKGGAGGGGGVRVQGPGGRSVAAGFPIL